MYVSRLFFYLFFSKVYISKAISKCKHLIELYPLETLFAECEMYAKCGLKSISQATLRSNQRGFPFENRKKTTIFGQNIIPFSFDEPARIRRAQICTARSIRIVCIGCAYKYIIAFTFPIASK